MTVLEPTMPAGEKGPFRNYIAGAAALCLMLGAMLWYYGPTYIESRLNQLDIEGRFTKSTGGSFTSGDLRLRLWPLPHVIIPDARITIPGRISGRWQTLRLYPSYSALLSGNFRIGDIIVENPDFAVAVAVAAGTTTAAPHPPPKVDTLIPLLPNGLLQPNEHLQNATVEVRDGSLRISGPWRFPLQIDALNLDVHLPPAGISIDLRCKSNKWGSLRMDGNLHPGTWQGQLRIAIDRLDPTILSQQLGTSPIRWESTAIDVNAMANLMDDRHATIDIQSHIPRLRLINGPKDIGIENVLFDGMLTLSPDKYLIEVDKLEAEQPFLALSGQAAIHPKTPSLQVELVGRNLRIDPLRQAALALAGDNDIVADIFDVLRGGSVPWIRFATQGKRFEEMGVFRNMTIDGVVEKGDLFIPGAKLDLTDVRGTARIAQGVLKGSDLYAAYGRTTGTKGRLWLDLDQDDDVPFFLEIDVDADLAPLPELLEGWVDDPVFKGEMQRIGSVAGTAEGMLVLDGRSPMLDVTVDVTHCRLEAEYDRLPASLIITQGMVQYTKDRIQVIQANGRLGKTVFNDLTAHIAFGDTALLQVDHASADIDLDQIIPWLDTYNLFQSWPFSFHPQGSRLNLDRWQMKGPLLGPEQWTFHTRGTLNTMGVASPDLPGPAELQNVKFLADESQLQIPEASIQMADAKMAFHETRLHLKSYRLISTELTIKGKFGPRSSAWISERIDLGEPWRLRTPVTVATATLNWSAGNKRSFLGDMTTGGGTRLKLDVKMEADRLQYQSLVVQDQDSQASLQVSFGPENFDIDFNGRISSTTLDRTMQANPYPSGYMEGQFQARIYPKHPGSSSVEGTLRARGIHQPLRMAHTLHIDELVLEAVDNRIRLMPAVLVIDGQTHRLEGTIDTLENDFVLDLVHTATKIRLALPKPPSESLTSVESEDVSIWEWPLKGRIISKLGTFVLGDIQWAPFNATVHLDKKHWDFRIEEAALCGIETNGSIRITPDSTAIALQPEAQDQNLNNTMTCLLEKPGLIDGRFDIAGHLGTEGPSGQLDQSIQGQMEFNARGGRIYRFTLLSKALAVVNLTEIFRGKLPDLMEGGLAYESIDIKVSIKDSVCTIKQAVIDGASANIAGQGTVNLVTGDTDMVVLVAPFKTVDALVKYTPVIGDWLGGTLISIPVRVTGAFSDPTVTPLSPTAVGSSLMNLMKKTANLPIKIVEPLWKGNE